MELRRLHDLLLDAEAALGVVVSATEPTRAAIAAARHRLMAASNARRRFLDRSVYPALTTAGHGDVVASLRQQSSRQLAESVKHVGAWDNGRALGDLAGYAEAAGVARRALVAQVALERRLLYPLLTAEV